MTQAQLESLKNTLLASGQPITAVTHRNWAQKIIDELYNAASRGKVLATIDTVLSSLPGDKSLIIRGADAKLIDNGAIASGIVDSDVTVGASITLDLKSASDIRLMFLSTVTSTKTISMSNSTNAKRFVMFFEITTIAAALVFPSTFKMKSLDTRWNSGTHTWTSDYATGKFMANAWFDGANWNMEISEANFI